MDAKVKDAVTISGQVKYTSMGKFVKWQTGTISVFYDPSIKEWKCEIQCNARRAPSTIVMKPRKIGTLSCNKQYFRLDMVNGDGITFKGSGLDQLGTLATSIKNQCAPAVEIKAQLQRSPLTSPHQRLQQQQHQQPNMESASPPSPHFTGMKSMPGKENQVIERTPDENTRKKSTSFLERGREKSSETLSSFSFYGNKTSTPMIPSTRCYGAFANTSGIKRRPTTLPNPQPRPRFNTIPYSWRSTPTYSADRVPLQGFSNLGNTCYMNAILQSLFGLDPFSTDLFLLHRKARSVLGEQPQALFPALGCLLMAKKRVSTVDQQSHLLANVKKAISASYKRFSGHEQHDAHEFLGIVLDQLKEEVIKLNKDHRIVDVEKTGGEEETNILDQLFYNPTMLNFEFEVQHTITCQQCGEELNKVESFHDLSLDMPRRKEPDVYRSIQDALDLFFQPESLDYVCEQCSCKQSKVTHKFTRLPRVIVLHLKRYRHNSIAAAKLGRSINIPKFLTLKDHCTELTQPSYPPVSIYNSHKLSSKDPALGNYKIPKFSEKGSTSKRKLDFKQESSDQSFSFKRIARAPSDSDVEDGEVPQKKEKLAAPSPIRKILTEEELAKLSESEQLEYVLEMSRQEEEQKQRQRSASLGTPRAPSLASPRPSATATCSSIKASHFDGVPDELADFAVGGDDFFKEALESSKQESDSLWEKTPSRSVVKTERSMAMDSPVTTSCESNIFHLYSEGSVEESQPHRSNHTCGNPLIVSQVDGQYDDDDDDMSSDEGDVHPDMTNCNTVVRRVAQDACRYCGLSHHTVNTPECTTVRPQSLCQCNISHSDQSSCLLCLGLQVDGLTDYVGDDNHNQNNNKNDEINLFTDNEQETSPGPRRRLSGKKTPLRKRSTPSAHQAQSLISNYFSPEKLPPECVTGGTDDIELKSDSEGDDSRLVPPHHSNLPPQLKPDSDNLNNGQNGHDQANNKSSSDGGRDVVTLPQTPPNQPSPEVSHQQRCRSASPIRREDNIIEDDTDDSDTFVTLKSAKASRETHGGADKEYHKDGAEENKENRTPPNASPAKDEPDWITERRREREEREVREAMEASLREHAPSLSDPEMTEEEQIRRATELSLRDFNEACRDMTEEETPFEYDLERSEKEEKILKQNAQTGHLPYSYQLMSVVSHLGSSTAAGHYVSDVYDQRKRQWMSYDDNHVAKTTELEVCCSRQKTGYIFFYMNKDLVAEVDGYYQETFPRSDVQERPASR